MHDVKAVSVAMGHRPADLVIQGGRLVNVFTREIYPADIAVVGRRIAAVGNVDYAVSPETTIIDASGMYLTPGLIDQHIHIHETQLDIVQFAAAVLPRGTTGVCTDLYGEMVVGGKRAVRLILDAARGLPMKVWFVLGTPGYYQNDPFGHSGWPSREEMLEMLDWPECYGMDDAFASKIAAGDPRILELVDAVQAKGKKVCGHGSEIRGRHLNAWMAYVRATDDHETVDADEAVEKARAGVYVSMREGSGCFNVSAVARAVSEYGIDPRRFCFCTDLISPLQIADDGHIDNAVRRAIQTGIPPVVAVQMATLNAAECLKVDDDAGSISPGKIADILLVDDLAAFHVAAVVADGALVARDGALVASLPRLHYPDWAYGTVRLRGPVTPEDFALAVSPERGEVVVRVITASGRTLLTGEVREPVTSRDGQIGANVDRDILKIAAIERVRGTGEIGVGLIRGFGLRSGAIATTYNSQQQNIVVLGADDGDMALAANTLARTGGGFVLVDRGEVRGLLELPLFGLESDRPYDQVVSTLRELNAVLASMGCRLPAPFHTLGFMGLPVDIGTLKISPRGLVDVWQGTIVPVTVG
jgi:adenine deaminase